MYHPRRASAVLLAAALLLVGCGSPSTATPDTDRLQVVTTTGILADLTTNVAGDRADVHALVPEGGDPHSYEPTLRDVRDIVYADVAFSNYLMLEEQNLIKSLDTNLRPGVPNVALAEEAVKYAAEIIPLVEDVSLDTIWLGLRVTGDGADRGATRTSDVILSATAVSGPGDLIAYLTGSFGDVERYFNSQDGFDAEDGYRDDTVTLPPDAHTHLSWAFTEPGVYTLDLQAKLQTAPDAKPIELGTDTVTFAVGVDPYSVPGIEEPVVLDAGHADISVDLDSGRLSAVLDHESGGRQSHGDAAPHREPFTLDDVVVEVPTKALHEIPGDPAYRFLGDAGAQIYQLPQAVLGKHVHGEIDPHLWQNVRNAMSYAEAIRDVLIEADPDGAADYTRNAAAYLQELAALDDEVAATIADIPPGNRTLVTTHDAFGYLAQAYDVTIAGFVTPNPAVEPSLAERKRLTETIRNLDVPAVFLEPNLAARSSTLVEVAKEQGIEVCPIYGDAFSEDVTTYVEMMRFNAHSLHDCLSPTKENR